MNKKILIIVVAGLALALIVGYATLSRTKESPTATLTPAPQTETTGEKTTLKNLLESTGSQQCTYADAETKTSGSVYVGNGRMRGDILSDVSGTQVNSHMISDGKFVYVWTDDSDEGVKISLSSAMSGETGEPTETVDLNREVDYSCQPWQVDASKFTLPSIKFNDFSAFLDDIKSQATPAAEAGSNNCQICDSLEGEAASACRSALNCE